MRRPAGTVSSLITSFFVKETNPPIEDDDAKSEKPTPQAPAQISKRSTANVRSVSSSPVPTTPIVAKGTTWSLKKGGRPKKSKHNRRDERSMGVFSKLGLQLARENRVAGAVGPPRLARAGERPSVGRDFYNAFTKSRRHVYLDDDGNSICPVAGNITPRSLSDDEWETDAEAEATHEAQPQKKAQRTTNDFVRPKVEIPEDVDSCVEHGDTPVLLVPPETGVESEPGSAVVSVDPTKFQYDSPLFSKLALALNRNAPSIEDPPYGCKRGTVNTCCKADYSPFDDIDGVDRMDVHLAVLTTLSFSAKYFVYNKQSATKRRENPFDTIRVELGTTQRYRVTVAQVIAMLEALVEFRGGSMDALDETLVIDKPEDTMQRTTTIECRITKDTLQQLKDKLEAMKLSMTVHVCKEQQKGGRGSNFSVFSSSKLISALGGYVFTEIFKAVTVELGKEVVLPNSPQAALLDTFDGSVQYRI